MLSVAAPPAVSCWPRLVDATVTAGLTGLLLAVLSGLGSGSLGPGALQLVGERWWAVGGSSVLVVLFGAAAWLVVELVRGRSAVGEPARIYSLPAARTEPAKAEQSRPRVDQPKAEQSKVRAEQPRAKVDLVKADQVRTDRAAPASGRPSATPKSSAAPSERRRNAG